MVVGSIIISMLITKIVATKSGIATAKQYQLIFKKESSESCSSNWITVKTLIASKALAIRIAKELEQNNLNKICLSIPSGNNLPLFFQKRLNLTMSQFNKNQVFRTRFALYSLESFAAFRTRFAMYSRYSLAAFRTRFALYSWYYDIVKLFCLKCSSYFVPVPKLCLSFSFSTMTSRESCLFWLITTVVARRNPIP